MVGVWCGMRRLAAGQRQGFGFTHPKSTSKSSTKSRVDSTFRINREGGHAGQRVANGSRFSVVVLQSRQVVLVGGVAGEGARASTNADAAGSPFAVASRPHQSL